MTSPQPRPHPSGPPLSILREEGEEHVGGHPSPRIGRGAGGEGGGFVEAIHIADVSRAPMRAVPDAAARAGRGLEGDRYARGGGTFSEWPRDHEFTLVEAESLEAAGAEYGMRLAPGESRRNVTTRGIALNPLVGKRFRVGDVLCEGTRLCEPCAHLELVTGKGGLCRVLAGRGGLRARLLRDGVIRVGDPVTVEGE